MRAKRKLSSTRPKIITPYDVRQAMQEHPDCEVQEAYAWWNGVKVQSERVKKGEMPTRWPPKLRRAVHCVAVSRGVGWRLVRLNEIEVAIRPDKKGWIERSLRRAIGLPRGKRKPAHERLQQWIADRREDIDSLIADSASVRVGSTTLQGDDEFKSAVRQAAEALDSIEYAFEYDFPDQWCLATGKKPTRREIEDYFLQSMASGFGAGMRLWMLRSLSGNAMAMRMATKFRRPTKRGPGRFWRLVMSIDAPGLFAITTFKQLDGVIDPEDPQKRPMLLRKPNAKGRQFRSQNDWILERPEPFKAKKFSVFRSQLSDRRKKNSTNAAAC